MINLKKKLISHTVITKYEVASKLSFDYFKVTSDPVCLQEASEYLSSIFPVGANCILSPGLGALGLSTAISQCLLRMGKVIPVVTVRDPLKSRIGESLVEGNLPAEPRAVYIDDTIVSGSTFYKTVDEVKKIKENLEIIGIQLIVDVKHLYGSRVLAAKGIPIQYCFSKYDIGVSADDIGMYMGGDRILAVHSPSSWNVNLSTLGFSFTRQASVPMWTKFGILVGDNNNKVALIRESGLVWEIRTTNEKTKGVSQDFLVVEDTLIFADYSGYLFSIDIETGEENWRVKCGTAVHATPILVGTHIYVSAENYNLNNDSEEGVLLKIDTLGNIIWSKTFSNRYSPGTPAFSNGVVVVSSNDLVVRGFQEDNEIWSYTIRGKVWGAILGSIDNVYIADNAGWVYCIEATSGTLIWQNNIAKSFMNSIPIIRNNTLIVSDSNTFTHGLDLLTGERKWISKTRSQIPWRPMDYDENHIVLLGQDCDISIVDTRDGVKKAENMKLISKHHVLQPGSIKDDNLCILTVEGILFSFKLRDI